MSVQANKMEIQKYSELKKAVTNKFNLFLVFVSGLLLIDYAMGSAVVEKFMLFQLEFRGVKPPYKLFAIFGTFDNIHSLSRRFELVLMIFLLLSVSWSLFSGWLSGIRMKN